MGVFHAIQAAFTTGEISPAVAARVDLEKYKSALLTANNVILRAYGGLYKRPGTIFLGKAKYDDKKCIIVKFSFSFDQEYILELGHLYMRVWKDRAYTGVEVETPWEESLLSKLKFTQSADVMYVCSGDKPIQTISRYSETDWRIDTFDFTNGPFETINLDEDNKITPSAQSGTITLNASKESFNNKFVGSLMKISHYIPSKAVKSNSGIGGSIPVGVTWKVITHGTWAGTVSVEQSTDEGVTWHLLRQYTSNSDYNAVESGDVDDKCLIRANASISSGSVTVDLTAYPYTHEGIVKITEYTSPTQVTATVIDKLGSAEATADWYMGAWNDQHGYPSCATFWNDRLCVANTRKNKQTIWMCRTGDYPNFGVEKAGGEVLDDSAITLPLVSRQVHEVKHLVPLADLIAHTAGAEWSISGGDVVSPSTTKATPQNYRGTNDIEPQLVGNRIIYIQQRGNSVRDLGYSYDVDSYTGIDVTLLAKHLVEQNSIVDVTYAQEPDSLLWFVRNDGKILTLTYLREQDVYAWSLQETNGKFEGVCSINGDMQDDVYFVVNRENGRFIEVLDSYKTLKTANNYVFMDSSIIVTSESGTNEVTGLEHLEGQEVRILADGQWHPNLTVTNGKLTLQFSAKHIIVGLPYMAKIQTPNLEMQLKDGTLQGRNKKISKVVLRLYNSLNASIGSNFDLMDDIRFDHYSGSGNVPLFTGDKEVQMPNGGFNNEGRICLKHDCPYPFQLQSIAFEVTLGG